MNPSDGPKLTHHGYLGGDTRSPKQPALKRRNSVRRIAAPVLKGITENESAHPADRALAAREMEVRAKMLETNQQQVAKGRMAAERGASATAIEAVRFSSSAAEEAIDQLGIGKKRTPAMLGVVEQGDRIGVGFSGDARDHAKTNVPLMQQMLQNAQQYAESGDTSHWSGTLRPATGGDVTSSRPNHSICAAQRATMTAKQVTTTEETRSVHATARQSLVEVERSNFDSRHRDTGGGRAFSTAKEATRSMKTLDPKFDDRVGTRPRAKSLGGIVDSCTSCRQEHGAIKKPL